MNKGLLLLVALWAFVAIANARPLMFFADLTDAPLGLSNGWTGIAYGWSSLKKGQNSHRIRFYGVTHILNDTITDAWLQYKNGTIIEHIAYTTTLYNNVLGDLRVNNTIWSAFTTEQIYLTVATKTHTNGSITGYFRCRPHQAISILDASQVVGGSNSSSVGIGWGEIAVGSINSLPQDVLDQDAAIASSSFFNGRVLHNSTDTIDVTLYGPANTTSNGPAIANATLYGPYLDGKFTNVTVTDDFYAIDSGNLYYAVHTNATGSGTIRGQLYPILSPTRRSIPTRVDTVNGNTQVPTGGFHTLRYANQQGLERNSNSYVALVSTANPTNFTYLGVFYMRSATNKRNFDLVRALSVEMNLRVVGTGTWLFEFFDSTTGEFIPAATVTTADNWTPAYIDNWAFETSDFANNRHELIMRISVNSAVQSTLQLDLFGVRSWTPSSFSNQFLKPFVKILDSYPGKFANGTLINV